jgi:hypothetical protein
MPPEEIRSAAPVEPAEPWRSFLRDLDQRLIGPIELRCLGGFVVTQHYGIGRETSDIDFLTLIAQSPEDDVERLAGLGSELHRKYRLYLQHVGIATVPSGYAKRLTRMFPSAPWNRLSLFALDATDLALSKLRRIRRPKFLVVDISIQGLVQSEHKLRHGKSPLQDNFEPTLRGNPIGHDLRPTSSV